MEISVIMLTYNREGYVSKAIESILRQNFRLFEFIIVNNGSTDMTNKILEEYSEKDERIRIVTIEKSSIGKGRNVGLDHAVGRYITFIDDDDYAEWDMLETLYRIAEDERADMVVCGSTKQVEGKIMPNFVFNDYLVLNAAEAMIELLKREKYNAAMPTKLLRKELFHQIRFKEDGKYEDITATYRYFAKADKVVVTGIPKYCFVRHENNNSDFTMDDKKINPEQLEEYFNAFRERTEYVAREVPDAAAFAQYSEWSYLISMCNKICSNNLHKCSNQLQWIKNKLIENYEAFYYGDYIRKFEKKWMDEYIGKEIRE